MSSSGSVTLTQAGIGCPNGSPGCMTNANLHTAVNNSTPTWWHIDPSLPSSPPYTSTPTAELGGQQYIPGQITFLPNSSDSDIYIAGRAGVWATTDATSMSNPYNLTVMSSMVFFPAVAGLASTVDHQVVTDPNGPANADVGDTDWTNLVSTNRFGGSNPTSDEPLQSVAFTGSTARNGTVLAATTFANTATTTVFVGGKNSEVNPPTGPQVPFIWYNTDPYNKMMANTSNSWVSIPTPPNTGNIIGMTVGQTNSTTLHLIVALQNSATGSSLAWTSCNLTNSVPSCPSPTWHLITYSTVSVGHNPRNSSVSLAWPEPNNGTENVYLYDQIGGLWISNDGGQTWGNDTTHEAWPVPTMMPMTVDSVHSGYMVAAYSSSLGEQLFVTNGVNIFNVVHAEDCTVSGGGDSCSAGATFYDQSTSGGTGPVATNPGQAAYVTQTSFSPTVELCRLPADWSGGVTENLVSDSSYQAFELTPADIAISSDGTTLYLANPGQGVGVMTKLTSSGSTPC